MAENVMLTAKQEALVLALAQGKTITDAATACKVAERTCYRWLQQDHVKTALERARQEAFEENLGMLRVGIQYAMKALLKHISAKDVKPTAATQVQAARAWIEQAIEIHQTDILEERIAHLETLLEEKGIVQNGNLRRVK